MSSLATPLFWCLLQVTLLATIAAALYAIVRRVNPRAAGLSILTGLMLIAGLSLLTGSSWPHWSFLRSPSEKVTDLLHLEVPARPLASPLGMSSLPTTPGAEKNATGVPHPSTSSAATTAAPAWNWVTAIPLLLLFASGCGLLRLIGGLLAVRSYRRDSRPILDADVLELVDILQAELSCRTTLEVRESPGLETAATVGWRRPVILLPADWRSWTEQERRVVLGHEIAHIRQGDYQTWICAQAVLVLHFYHPLLHWLVGRLRLEQELTADALAATVSDGRRAYLTTLADLALRQSHHSVSWPARTFLPVRGTFMRRIEMLRDSNSLTTRNPSQFTRWVTSGTLCLAGLAIAGLRPSQAVVQESAGQIHPMQAAAPAAGTPQPTSDAQSKDKDAGQATDEASVKKAADREIAAEFKDDAEDQKGATDSKYQTADQAFNIGAAFYNAGNYAGAQEPFEAALKLSDDVKFRVKTYRALMSSYRLQMEIEKMLVAVEYIVANSEQPAEQSIVRRSLLSFVHQRGKTDVAIKHYEDQLKADPNNRTALFLLSEIYAQLKNDPQRSAALIERLAAVEKKSGKAPTVSQQAQLAQQYVGAKKFKEGAELYENIAPLDNKLAAWHWKEAASAWLKAGDKQKALAAAKKSNDAMPEGRSELLAHFWHKGLADAFLEAGDPKLAIPHYEQAIATTDIDGYIKASREKLAEAKQKAGESK